MAQRDSYNEMTALIDNLNALAVIERKALDEARAVIARDASAEPDIRWFLSQMGRALAVLRKGFYQRVAQ